jgi:Glycosyl transferase family 2
LTPRVTVLLPVYNGVALLNGAVESVLEQTFDDLELLVVDDGSTDGSADAVLAFGDQRIRLLVNEQNMGQTASLNRGLAEARGEYVARLDQDDVCLPRRLELQVAALDAEPSVALVGTWLDVVDERGRLWAKLRGHVRDFPELVFAILADRYPWGHPSLMFRRDVVLELGGYDEQFAPAEDKDLYRRLALARHDARCIEAPLIRYRRHEGQLSQERAEVQLRHDWESQERFLGELAGAEHAHPLRLLLSGGDGGEAAPELLQRLLAGAEQRLELSAPERGKLESLLSRHLNALGRRRRVRDLTPPLGARPLRPLRRLARRSRLLRYLYGRLGAP